jgi:hypothetical protein
MNTVKHRLTNSKKKRKGWPKFVFKSEVELMVIRRLKKISAHFWNKS